TLHGRQRAAAVVGVVVGAGALFATYVALTLTLDVSPTGASANARGGLPIGRFLSYLWQFYLPRLPFMSPAVGPHYGVPQVYIERFCGTFGSLEVRFPARVYDLLAIGSLAAVVAVVAALIVNRRSLRAHWREAVVLVGLALTTIVGLHIVAF